MSLELEDTYNPWFHGVPSESDEVRQFYVYAYFFSIDGDSNRAIQYYTEYLKHNPTHIRALMARAKEYELRNQNTLAVQDWISVTLLKPQDGNAYFEAGRLYYKMAEYSNAIDILERGLELVEETQLIYLEKLNKLLETSIRMKGLSWADPITLLPFDLICLIFSYLPLKNRIECSRVSFSWRSLCLGWAGMWHELDFNDQDVSETEIIRCIRDAGEKVLKRLTINHAEKDTKLEIFKILGEKANPHLTQLEINGLADLKIEFLTTLHSIGRNLTYLYIRKGPSLSVLVNNILPLCPNLTHFGGDLCAPEERNKPFIKTDTKFRLTHLLLSLEYGPCIRVTDLRAFLACCPKLVTLDFQSERFHFRDFGYSIIKACPELENIFFQSDLSVYPRKSWKSKMKTRKEPGWSHLEIAMDNKFNEKILWGILSHYYHTLKSIKIHQCISMNGISGELYGGTHQFAQLQDLYIGHCEHLNQTVLENLLLSCQSLKRLHLVDITVVDTMLAQAVGPALKLEKLEISQCRNMTIKGLKLWIEPSKETLKEVILYQHNLDAEAIDLVMKECGKGVERKGKRYYFSHNL
ncbi:hypothetical protein K501DRAFT_337234 [Backusella circina FSU 941]|nr:hypothetical protein K501DRAFT_337234 [Backusella circina FSU 941]